MNTRNRKSRRPVTVATNNVSTIPIQSIDSQTHNTMEGSLDDFEEVKVPLWIGEMFGVETITGSKLAQIYTTFMGLHQFQQRNILCDVNIKVGNTLFPAHKAVLAASSRFFRSMFTSGFQESQEPEASITGKPEAFKVILDYCYSYELTLSVDTVVDVLEMSHYLQLDSVMKRCEQFLIDELNKGLDLDTKAAVKSLATARMYGLEVLIEAAKKCIAKNFTPTGSFLHLMTMELLEEILGRNDLKDEKQVFDTILAWLQHDWNKRKKFAPALFSKIRLGIVPVGHLSVTLLKCPKLYQIKECGELFDKALKLLDVRKPGDAALHFSYPSLFAARSMINATLSIDTTCGHYYDNETKRWITLNKFPPLPEKDNNNNGDSCLSTNGHLYVSRGTASLPRKLKCPQFLRLDMLNNRWVPLEPMTQRRQNACLVASNGKIYAVGGEGYDFRISCEVYNINANTWRSLPSLFSTSGGEFRIPTKESCKVYKDKLLVYTDEKTVHTEGTTTSKDYLKMYDPVSKRWTTLMEDKHPNQQAIIGLVINNDKCYRISCCECLQVAECQCQKKFICVEEIVIDLKGKTAHIGDRQEQELITRASAPASEKKKGFIINQNVYVIHNKQFFKTGLKIPRNRTDPIKLGRWNQHLKLLTSRQSMLLVRFMFDKEKWL